jgi:hypothetical protein
MSTFDSREDEFGKSDGAELQEEELQEVQLGDALGNDNHLIQTLNNFDERISEDAPGISNRRTIDLMGMIRDFVPRAWSVTKTVVEWGVNRFTDREIKKIQVEAEARSKIVLAEAQAKSKLVMAEAQADKIRAESEQIRDRSTVELAQGLAVAEETRAQTNRKDEIVKQLRARGIDWRCELGDDGKERIVVTKKPPILPDQSNSSEG